jgi:hypothetical protein
MARARDLFRFICIALFTLMICRYFTEIGTLLRVRPPVGSVTQYNAKTDRASCPIGHCRHINITDA